MRRLAAAALILAVWDKSDGHFYHARAQDAVDATLFEQKIRPLLDARCGKCHDPARGKVKAGLRLDSRDAVLKGGDSGPALVPGKPDDSLLVKAVRGLDPDFAMPPKEKLPQGEVDLLVDWVRRGAPWSDAKAAKPAKREKAVTDADRAWWAFQPLTAVAGKLDIDRALDGRLAAESLRPAPEADRRTLIRRATFDLHGLPPAPEDVDAFLADASPEAWTKLVDRLLASPRYGERWGRKWLDLVRYADSDGHRQDALRPHAWPYRDYVIRAFNDDKPYDRFIAEQLAGDELAPGDPAVFVATGFLRLGMYEYNQRNVPQQWSEILNDLTDVTGDVFLGLGMGCARCHDHKFDPILQSDYYRLQSFFAGMLWRDDLFLAAPREIEAYRAKLVAWETKTAAVRAELAAVEEPHLKKADATILDKFIPEFREIIVKPADQRTPWEHQIADLGARQVRYERSQIDGKIKGPEREKWAALKRRLAEFDDALPKPLPPAFVATDVGPVAPPVVIPGDPSKRVIDPAWLTVLPTRPVDIKPTDLSTGRRSALAAWLARPDHPLTARVMVNRIWQSHFGRGLAPMASDFGRLGEPPTHPELLDALARAFVDAGWSVKAMHRAMMSTAAYRRASVHPDPGHGRLKDPENRLLWRMSPRRLEAEEVRDAILAATGELDRKPGGPATDASGPRRSIYTKVIRNARDPLLEAFDGPEAFSSVAGRNVTTTAPQALLLINGAWPLHRAAAFAARIKGSDPVEEAYRAAFGRSPRPQEREAAHAFLLRAPGAKPGGAADPPLVQATPHRGGQSVRIRGARPEDRLRLTPPPALPAAFTIEAVVVLDSLHPDASVRTIVSHWSGKQDEPGWSLGITSEKSKHDPRNLILQLSGKEGYEVIASDLRIELHKLHYVGVAVTLSETGEAGVAFTLRDLTDPDALTRTASVRHKVTGGLVSPAGLIVGGRDSAGAHLWDGLIDEVRLCGGALPASELLLNDGEAPAIARWKFEGDAALVDATRRTPPLVRMAGGKAAPPSTGTEAALVDFCHVLLNSSEFLYVD